MPRPTTGQVVERVRKTGTVYAIRFPAYGNREYLTLGTKAEGWSKAKAEDELANVLADVRRGIWQPPTPETGESPAEVPTFHRFATDWLGARQPELRPRTVKDYTWSLSHHLLPFFKDYRLDEIDAALVDRFKTAKAAEGRLAPPRSISASSGSRRSWSWPLTTGPATESRRIEGRPA